MKDGSVPVPLTAPARIMMMTYYRSMVIAFWGSEAAGETL